MSVAFPDDEDVDCEYYVANGKGVPICIGECITIDNDEGVEMAVPWTLQAYIQLSSIKYASKARFYCVKRWKGMCFVSTMQCSGVA